MRRVSSDMRRSLCCLLLFAALAPCRGQLTEQVQEKKFFAGLGLGLDHGGAGLRLDARLHRYVGLFFGLGATFADIGYNGGVHARILPAKRLCPYATAMYGFNAESTGFDGEKLFYGPSFGAGVEWVSFTKMSFFHIGAIVPVHSEEAKEVSENSDFPFWPVLPTFGIHLALGKRPK